MKLTLVFSKLHAEIDKNTETTISILGTQVIYEAEINQKTKLKCQPRQQTNAEINVGENRSEKYNK
jgi:hypothetical protein